MGIREKLNDNPAITTGITAGIIVIALIVIGWQLMSSGRPEIPTQAFYSIDDGASYFPDNINLFPPFKKDGKDAVRAHVFRCDGGEPFIAYLERYTPEAKAKMEAMQTKTQEGGPDPGMYDDVQMTGQEVKAPKTGDKGWVKMVDYQSSQDITSPKCPDGTTNKLEPVYP